MLSKSVFNLNLHVIEKYYSITLTTAVGLLPSVRVKARTDKRCVAGSVPAKNLTVSSVGHL